MPNNTHPAPVQIVPPLKQPVVLGDKVTVAGAELTVDPDIDIVMFDGQPPMYAVTMTVYTESLTVNVADMSPRARVTIRGTE